MVRGHTVPQVQQDGCVLNPSELRKLTRLTGVEGRGGEGESNKQKGISRGTERCKFQLRSTFHCGVKGLQKITSISVKTPYYSPWILAKI